MPSSGILHRVALVKNRRFGGTYRLHHQGDVNFRSSPIVNLKKQTILSSETSVLTVGASGGSGARFS
jgi:hypothetical protein